MRAIIASLLLTASIPCTQAQAAVANECRAAESTVREALTRDYSKDSVNIDKRFLDPGLYASFLKNGRRFNADWYRGTQEPDKWKLKRLSTVRKAASGCLVEASFDVGDVRKPSRNINYDVRLDGGQWRIWDINDGASFRQLLRGL